MRREGSEMREKAPLYSCFSLFSLRKAKSRNYSYENENKTHLTLSGAAAGGPGVAGVSDGHVPRNPESGSGGVRAHDGDVVGAADART